LSYEIEKVDIEGNEERLDDEESVFVTLTEQETGYSTTVSYPSEAETVLLIPGTYTISGSLVSDSPFDITIDADAFEKCTSAPVITIGGLFGFEDDASCTDVEYYETELEMAASGGLELEWDADRYELDDASHVTIFVTSPGHAETEEDLEAILAYLDYGLGYKEPELS